jgi:hypothetical protein
LKRSRGRGRRPQNNHNRSFDSTGPDVKIRGTAAHVYEKYLQLARDASSSGDRVMAENYLQHAEHYYRILMASQAHQQQNPQFNANGANGGGGGEQRPNGEGFVPPGGSAPSFSLSDDMDDVEEGEEAA